MGELIFEGDIHRFKRSNDIEFKLCKENAGNYNTEHFKKMGYEFFSCDEKSKKCKKLTEDEAERITIVHLYEPPNYKITAKVFPINTKPTARIEAQRTIRAEEAKRLPVNFSRNSWSDVIERSPYFFPYSDIATTRSECIKIAGEIIKLKYSQNNDIKDLALKFNNFYQEQISSLKKRTQTMEPDPDDQFKDMVVTIIEWFDLEYLKITGKSYLSQVSDDYAIDEKFRYLYYDRLNFEKGQKQIHKKLVELKNNYDISGKTSKDRKLFVLEFEVDYLELYKKKYEHPKIPDNIYADINYMRFNTKEFEENIANPMIEKYKEQYHKMNQWIIPNNPMRTIKRLGNIMEKDPVFVQMVDVKLGRNGKIIIIGDIHSSLHSLWEILEKLRDVEKVFTGDTMILKENKYIFFLGDMVDRGPYGIEILYFVFKLKLLNLDKVFIINGNHEDKETYERYGLGYEIENQFERDGAKLIEELLKYLPSAIYVRTEYGQIFHMSHGAFDMEFSGFNEKKDFWNPNNNLTKLLTDEEKKFALVRYHDPYNNFKWGDKDGDDEKWYSDNSARGGGIGLFHVSLIMEYLRRHNIECIISGHQDYVNFGIIPSNNAAGLISSKQIKKSDVYPNEIYGIDGTGGQESKEVTLKASSPGRAFWALITSTATISRNISNCYCVLKDN